jgi:transposase
LNSENLLKHINELESKVSYLEDVLKLREREIDLLKQALSLNRHKLFGRQSEQSHPELPNLFSDIQTEVEIEVVLPAKPTADGKSIDKPKRLNPNLNGRMDIPENLPRKDVYLDLSEAKKICPATGRPLIRIGEDITEQLAIKPLEVYAIRYHIPKYASPDRRAGLGIFTPDLPPHPLNRCKADVSLLAYIIEEKFLRHMPLHRIADKLRDNGIYVAPSTLNDWVSDTAEVLEELHPSLRQAVLESEILNSDDTPIDMLIPRGKGQKRKTSTQTVLSGRLWCYYSPISKLAFFEFTKDWKNQHPVNMLAHYTGFLQSDGYRGYEKAAQSENIIQVGCWAHARRKFFDAEKISDPEAGPFVLLINLLYRIEHHIRDRLAAGKRPIEELSEIRIRRTTRVMNRFFEKAKSTLLLPKSLLGKAIKYALNHEQELRNYILDIRMTPDNNFALSSSFGYSQTLAIPA